MVKLVKFYEVTRRLLRDRLDILKRNEVPTWTDIRHFFYECRNRFLRENLDLMEIDSRSVDPYTDWQKVIKGWCEQHCEEFGISPDHWWRLREKLNIWAEARATCEGESGKFLVDHSTREQVTQGCSFVLMCEKKTVARELLEKLRGEGYRLNIVATVGHSTTDVQEAVIQLGEALDEETPNFYILMLHDYDVEGIAIYFGLKGRYQGVIDVGVNRDLIHHWIKAGDYDPRLVEEQNLNRKYNEWLKQKLEGAEGYTLEDFEYLQGEKIGDKRWLGKRVEIDAIHVQYGIQPFIDYIMEKIREKCPVWDLSRIGVEEFELEEPPNHYRQLIGDLEDRVGRAYGQKLGQLSEPLNVVLNLVRETLPQPPEFEELEEKYRGSKGSGYVVSGTDSYVYHKDEVKGVDPIKEKFGEQMKRDWAEDYGDELEEINQQITMYEGDVRGGEEDLKGQREELQERLETDKKEDPDLSRFSEELDKVEWGEEELEEIEVPDEADEIRKVIEALQERLDEIGGNRVA